MDYLEIFYKLLGVDNRMYIFHTVNLVLYVFASLMALRLLWFTFSEKNLFKPHPKMRRHTDYSRADICKVIRVTLVSIIRLCIIFLFLQWDWIVTDKNEIVGTSNSVLWLIFDYMNVICYICVITSIRVGLQWVGFTGSCCEDRRKHVGLAE
ncbi:hypothetical protein M316_0102 [Nitrincola phage 1M3-16]|uniref:hypothetical protein n=1 Tax=Nitrincola phage 1M3-16 TaxID=1472912 RepID=UPI000444B8D8|nr:hypothetical protein GJ22_gp050 [Nitrincola phage 1M3-16]AHX01167.1 hypothetical protein M316_0102 [Nitrincola phage 1M3-16]